MSKKRLIVFGLAGAVLLIFACFLVIKVTAKKEVPYSNELFKSLTKASPITVKEDKSNHLRIEKISVDAKIVEVGLTKAGNMGVPGNSYDVGLYSKGAKPGAQGTAVLAGHLDSATGQPGVFAKLKQLSAGDVIKIISPEGKENSFNVTRTKLYGANDRPSEVFSSTSGSHLNLITCTGQWDKDNKQYDSRLVVFTDLIK